MLNNSPMKFNVPGKLVVPRINRNNEVENTGYMLNELMKAKVNRFTGKSYNYWFLLLNYLRKYK